MPLIHSKKPSAFTKNLKTEMHAGKPQKQALAIAYSVKRAAEHKKADGGEMYARGGELGVHRSFRGKPGESYAGAKAKEHTEAGKAIAKQDHEVVLGELKSMGKPKLKGLADGGPVVDPTQRPYSATNSSIAQGIAGLGKHAEGGEIHEDEEQDMGMIQDAMADELMAAIDQKDKKRIMECIESLVMSCMSKRNEND